MATDRLDERVAHVVKIIETLADHTDDLHRLAAEVREESRTRKPIGQETRRRAREGHQR